MMEVRDKNSQSEKDSLSHSENGQTNLAARKDAPPPVLYAVLVGLFIVLAGVLFAGLMPRFETEEKLAFEEKAKQVAVASPAVIVHHAPADSQLALPANLQAVQEIPIFARVAGYLKERNVDIGDKVSKNQVLAIIDAPELDQQLDEARAGVKEASAAVKSAQADLARAQATLMNSRANLKKTEASLNFSKREIGRYVELETQGAISKEQRDEKQRDVDSDHAMIDAAKADIVANEAAIASFKEKVDAARAKVESANANLRRVQSLCSFKFVTAPCDGIITARNVDAGALVNEGSNSNVKELLKLSRIDVLRVFVQVPQNFYQAIKPGMPAAILVAEFPNKKFLAKVTRVSGGLDAASRTMQVEVRIPNDSHMLKPGMYGSVDFDLTRDHTAKNETPIMIPASSLVVKPNGLFVATVGEKNSVHFAPVTLGRDFGKELEVTGGLAEGQKILLDPGIELKEGASVTTEIMKSPKV